MSVQDAQSQPDTIEQTAMDMFDFDVTAQDAAVDIWPAGQPQRWEDADEKTREYWRGKAREEQDLKKAKSLFEFSVNAGTKQRHGDFMTAEEIAAEKWPVSQPQNWDELSGEAKNFWWYKAKALDAKHAEEASPAQEAAPAPSM